MILTLKFPGLMLKNCQVYRNQDHFGSMKIAWPFSTKATIKCQDNKWEIKEKKASQRTVEMFDLIDKQLIGETTINGHQNPLDTTQIVNPIIATIKIGENEYVLSENVKSPHQYAWIFGNRGEIVHYDNINLENATSLPLTFKGYIMTCMPDSSNKDYLALLFLGIYILRYKAFERKGSRVQAQVQDQSTPQ